MDRSNPLPSRYLKVAVLEESELVLQGLRAMLEPHSSVVSLLLSRPGEPLPVSDLTLYEPSAARNRAGAGAPDRFPTRMVAYSWDCSPHAVSTEMSRGAAGFVSKWVPARRLVRDLLHISAGKTVIDSWTGREEPSSAGVDQWHLTQRETEVLALIASGKANREIADETNLSINSVKSYIRGAYAKIEVTSRSQAVLWAVQHGLLVSGDADAALLRSAAAPRSVAHPARS
jgi:NarL family two-component system response regulator LiaR